MRERVDRLQVTIHFKDIARDEELIEQLETHCHEVAASFPELAHMELNAFPATLGVEVHVHGRGKGVDLAAHAHGPELRATADVALHRLERELRRHHDKKIFGRRRAAQRRSRHHYGDPVAAEELVETR